MASRTVTINVINLPMCRRMAEALQTIAQLHGDTTEAAAIAQIALDELAASLQHDDAQLPCGCWMECNCGSGV